VHVVFCNGGTKLEIIGDVMQRDVVWGVVTNKKCLSIVLMSALNKHKIIFIYYYPIYYLLALYSIYEFKEK